MPRYTKDSPPNGEYGWLFFDRNGKELLFVDEIDTDTGEVVRLKIDAENHVLVTPGTHVAIRITEKVPLPITYRRVSPDDATHTTAGWKWEGCTCKEWVNAGCPLWEYHQLEAAAAQARRTEPN